jgi:hypothetical protein
LTPLQIPSGIVGKAKSRKESWQHDGQELDIIPM